MKDSSLFIAIDFGTTNSSMAVFNDGQAKIIDNHEGEAKTPSLVYFGNNGVIVGKEVELLLDELKDADEETQQEDMLRVVRSVKRNLLKPRIPLPDNRDVRPIEAAAEIIRKLKRDAENEYFHEKVNRAVITCPAVFDTTQRSAIKEAATLAGFEEVELLEEPVAAALAFAHAGQNVGDGVLIYDLGGGTFDLAVVVRDGDSFRLAMETDGDARCGGDDFDQALYDFWEKEAQSKFERSIGNNGELDSFFLRECRKKKESLSIREQVNVSFLLHGGRFQSSITRAAFERLISEQVERTVRKTQALFKRAKDAGIKIDSVVMIGGSTRLPFVKNRLTEVLGIEPKAWTNKDVAVALGAAYYAHQFWMISQSSPKTFTNSIGMEFVKIPAGSFMMGAPESEQGSNDDERPQHKVTISRDFYVGKTEVTQEQWQAVMGYNPSFFKNCPKCPVETVLWEEAQEFIKKLNAKNEGVYRLPTEAEWEYAARAGTTGAYAGNLDAMAWYGKNSGGKTHEVETKQANAFGLYDMHGNVWEWTADWFGKYESGEVTDPTGASSGSDRVFRGGSWFHVAVDLRSASRGSVSPSYRRFYLGFRVVRE